MKVLAVGDIHTKKWILSRVRNAMYEYDAVVFCGDYADNWNATPMDTIETWKALRGLSKNNRKVKIVQGNHDYIYTHYTKTVSSGYNSITQSILEEPENKDLKDWLHNLPIIVHIDGVMYSHAGVNDAWVERYEGKEDPVSLWNELSPIWVRPGMTDYRSYQVFGHTPHKTCTEIQPNVWCIDTFSEYQDNTPIGDGSVLEITDGKDFKVVEL